MEVFKNYIVEIMTLVLQEEKASKVMYGKDVLYNGDGTLNVTSIQQVLGSSKCIWEKTE
jgi:hypothetical protein